MVNLVIPQSMVFGLNGFGPYMATSGFTERFHHSQPTNDGFEANLGIEAIEKLED